MGAHRGAHLALSFKSVEYGGAYGVAMSIRLVVAATFDYPVSGSMIESPTKAN